MSKLNYCAAILEGNPDECYERLLPEALALKEESLVPVNVDIPSALLTVMSVARKLPSLKSGLQALPWFPLPEVLCLPEYVLALYSAHLRFVAANEPLTSFWELLARARESRRLLLLDAKLLMSCGTLSAGLLRELSRTRGYKSVAFDLAKLSQLYRDNWELVQGRTGVREHEIEACRNLALTLVDAISRKEGKCPQVAAAMSIRQRMFVLLAGVYDELRRGVSYMRWHEGDADRLVPSLYRKGRASKGKKIKKEGA